MTAENIASLDVSRETIERLQAFADLTVKWTARINLISPSTIPTLWERHIVDSAQLFHYTPKAFAHWVDLGSGGGFPGIVAAIVGKEMHPEASFTLIESDQRKCTFLRTAAREFDLNVKVISKRIDDAEPQQADIVSARALSSVAELLPFIQRHLNPTGVSVLHKGRKWVEEIAQAKSEWAFEMSNYQSMTDPEARIIKLNRIARV
jgi:16S rRNA (guanine527-N7)-methyltransferase